MKRLLRLNPLFKPADLEQIREWAGRHEQLPVSTPLGEFEATRAAVEDLRDALEAFDDLPTLNPDGTLTWELADGSSVDITKTQLDQIIREIRRRRGIRRARLRERGRTFLQQATPPTLAQLADLSFWLEG